MITTLSATWENNSKTDNKEFNQPITQDTEHHAKEQPDQPFTQAIESPQHTMLNDCLFIQPFTQAIESPHYTMLNDGLISKPFTQASDYHAK